MPVWACQQDAPFPLKAMSTEWATVMADQIRKHSSLAKWLPHKEIGWQFRFSLSANSWVLAPFHHLRGPHSLKIGVFAALFETFVSSRISRDLSINVEMTFPLCTSFMCIFTTLFQPTPEENRTTKPQLHIQMCGVAWGHL